MPFRIAIVDDKPQIISSLTRELNYSGQVEIVITANNGADYLKQLNKTPTNKHPQVVLMDIDMPVMDGIEAVRQSSDINEDIKYIMLTVFDNDDKLFEAIKAGAHGYLLKEERDETILNAIKEVIEKQGAPMSPRIARKTLELLTNSTAKSNKEELVATTLSDREMEILKAQVSGMDYRQIAEQLFISPNTVRNHIAKIYDKLHISSKTQAIKLAIKNKWV